jgi:hypothetical protein
MEMFFGPNMMLDVLDSYLCEQNAARNRSLILSKIDGVYIHLRDTKETNKFLKKVEDLANDPSFTFFHLEKVFIPVNFNYHWTLYVVFPRRKHIVFYDTLNLEEPKCLPPDDILAYVENMYNIAGLRFRSIEWRYYRANVKQQGNSLDCGFCVIKNALLILHSLPMDLPVSLLQLYTTWMIDIYFKAFGRFHMIAHHLTHIFAGYLNFLFVGTNE